MTATDPAGASPAGPFVELHLPGPLADDAAGQRVHLVPADGVGTVADLLDAVGARYPALNRRVRDDTGGLRRFVNVFVGDEDVRWSDGLDTVVSGGDVVLVLPSVAGG